jgi:hypothetical protein
VIPARYEHHLPKKTDAILITGRGGLWGCEMLGNPHYLDNPLTDECEVVSSTHRPSLYSPETLLASFW